MLVASSYLRPTSGEFFHFLFAVHTHIRDRAAFRLGYKTNYLLVTVICLYATFLCWNLQWLSRIRKQNIYSEMKRQCRK